MEAHPSAGCAAAILVLAAGFGCAAGPRSPASATAETPPASDSTTVPAAQPSTPVLLGELARPEIEATAPSWLAAEVDAEPDPEAARALAQVEPGARVTVFLGTWCSDSRRELGRLWRGFDDAGLVDPAELPFELEYVGVDRDKAEPADRLAGIGLRYVPTFVVERGGREVGRVVELSPHGIERDLLALLRGEAAGLVTAREDLAADGEREVPGSHRR